MQIVAYGAQDIYITSNPNITFFKAVFRRYTNFAMESIEQTFNGIAQFGGTVSTIISRTGDLVNGVYLQTTLPNIRELTGATSGSETRWIDDIGHHLIDYVDISIGGQRIDRHYGDWLEIWAQLTVPAGKMRGYREMIGMDPLDPLNQLTGLQGNVVGSDAYRYNMTGTAENYTIPGRTIYVPLQFWFCRNIGLALPLISLQYHEVKITVKFKTLSQCVINSANLASPVNMGATSIWVDYIYLDTDERRRFALVAHEYLIEQLQFTGADVGSNIATIASNKKLQLQFNHPIKELIWVVQYDLALDQRLNQWSNYTTARAGPGNTPDDMGADFLDATDLINFYPIEETLTATEGYGASSGGSSSNTMSDQIASQPLHGKNPVVSAKLELNGHDRFSARPGTYFNWVQCMKHHTNIPASSGINVYSFALKPEDHHPSGTCNFSRIDNVTLSLTLIAGNNTDWGPDFSYQVRVYATNYNILRIMSGMAGVA
jgi:hypothetical protein